MERGEASEVNQLYRKRINSPSGYPLFGSERHLQVAKRNRSEFFLSGGGRREAIK